MKVTAMVISVNKGLSLTIAIIQIIFGKAEMFCENSAQSVDHVNISWPATDNTTISVPPCIGDDFEFMKRSCLMGKWDNSPKCAFIQTDVSPCPENLSRLQDKGEPLDMCYSVLPPGSFSIKCPYSNELSVFSYFIYLQKSITSNPTWLPVKREDDDFIGDYYYLEKSNYYGSRFWFNDIESSKPIRNKHCVLYDYNFDLTLANCDEPHEKVCVYKMYQPEDENICKIKFPDENCVQIIFEANLIRCVCLKVSKDIVTSRNEFCKKLVELHQPYQNFLVKSLTEERPCWIGLEKLNSKYVWSSTRTEINYTFWSSTEDFIHGLGAIEKNGWSLHVDKSLDCALCEKEIELEIPSLKLKYDEINYLLILEIVLYWRLKVLDDDDSFTFTCFLNSGVDDMKQRIDNHVLLYINVSVVEFSIVPDKYGPGFYWCEAFSLPNLENIKSNKVFVNDATQFGTEYVAKATIKYDLETNPLDKHYYKSLRLEVLNYLLKNSYLSVISVRKFGILNLNEDNLSIQFLLHITLDARKTEKDIVEHYTLKKQLNLALNYVNGTLDYFSSSYFCLNETVLWNNTELIWPTTLAESTALSQNLCLQKDGLFVSRRCVGDFVNGAKWDDIQGSCDQNHFKSTITDKLHSLLENELPTSEVVEKLLDITENFKNFEYIDIHLIGLIFQKVSVENNINVDIITFIISHIMDIDRIVLTNSQLLLNATDKILQNYDAILTNSTKNITTQPMLTITNNIILLQVNLKLTNIRGFAMFRKYQEISYEIIDTETNIGDILNNNSLDAVVLISNELVQQTKDSITASHFIVTVFLQDSLFNGDEFETKPSNIFGVLLPGMCKHFEAPISIFFKEYTTDNFNKKFCSHWQFASNNTYNTTSQWLESGVIEFNFDKNLVNCNFWHVTHFTLVAVGREIEDTSEDTYIFDIIAAVNCTVSMIGLMIIILTSLLFKSWRQNSGNQVLINISLAISLQIISFQLSRWVVDIEKACLTVGVILHYFVIAEFCWMFVLGILQFKRLVIVFGGPPTYVILKSCILGWGVPFIPVLLLIFLLPSSYISNGIVCYPTGLGFYLTVLLPISIILLSNFYIFMKIVYEICKLKSGSYLDILYRGRTIILLFFMLGLTWIFAFLAYLETHTVFLTMFNFFSTLQGFILFLYFIVFNRGTRTLYRNLFTQYTEGYRNKL